MSDETTPRAIEVRGLKKRFQATEALGGIDLEVKPGEIYGVIGPDGAGKTTLMRILCGLMLADEGDSRVLGFDPGRETAEVRARLGYMPQRFSLYPDLSVEENLRFFADLYLVSKDEYTASVPRLMEFSRLGNFRKRKAGALSGGMKQKLALICTLIHTPELLVLDEPTFGVDPVSRQEFWAILRDLAKRGLAIIVSTAYMDEAQLCDRLALMHHGRIIAQGTPEQVAGEFGHRLAEVVAEDIQALRTSLAALPGIEVHRFGDRLHVVYDTDEQEASMREAIQDEDASFTVIPPSIEDTFVALLRDERGEAA